MKYHDTSSLRGSSTALDLSGEDSHSVFSHFYSAAISALITRFRCPDHDQVEVCGAEKSHRMLAKLSASRVCEEHEDREGMTAFKFVIFCLCNYIYLLLAFRQKSKKRHKKLRMFCKMKCDSTVDEISSLL